MQSDDSDPVWFADGLSFACTQCGKCCGGAPGYVWLSEIEADALAERVGLDGESFRRRYTTVVKGRGRSLVEQPNYDCVFYDSKRGCTVYEDRPQQCRTWPFWRPLIASPEAWAEESEDCPGMNNGPRYDADHVISTAANDGLPG